MRNTPPIGFAHLPDKLPERGRWSAPFNIEDTMDTMLFSKQRAAELTNSFQLGDPIKPSGESWSVDELLQVASAAIVAITARTLEQTASQPLELQEARVQTRYDDLFPAVEFYSDLTVMVLQRTYDEQFSPLVRMELVRDGDDHAIRIVSGGKQQ
jgi:hypothetical protein